MGEHSQMIPVQAHCRGAKRMHHGAFQLPQMSLPLKTIIMTMQTMLLIPISMTMQTMTAVVGAPTIIKKIALSTFSKARYPLERQAFLFDNLSVHRQY